MKKIKSRRDAFLEIIKSNGMNGGKLLYSRNSAGEYGFLTRSRVSNIKYFLVRIKGNYIKAFSMTEKVFDSNPYVFVNRGIRNIYKNKTLIAKTSIQKCDSFISNFKEASPELKWVSDDFQINDFADYLQMKVNSCTNDQASTITEIKQEIT